MWRITDPSELEVPHTFEVVPTPDGRTPDAGAADGEEMIEEPFEHAQRWWDASDGIRADGKRGFDDDEEEDSDVDFDEFDDEEEDFETEEEESEKDDYEDEDEDDFDDFEEDVDDE